MTLTLPKSQARQYTTSRQLIAGDDFNNVVAQLNSNATGLTAAAGGGQAAALQLGARTNTIATVANANDSVKLPFGIPGLEVYVENDGANSAQVFLSGLNGRTGTIQGTDGIVTGVALANGATALYVCMSVSSAGVEVWKRFVSA